MGYCVNQKQLGEWRSSHLGTNSLPYTSTSCSQEILAGQETGSLQPTPVAGKREAINSCGAHKMPCNSLDSSLSEIKSLKLLCVGQQTLLPTGLKVISGCGAQSPAHVPGQFPLDSRLKPQLSGVAQSFNS